MSRPGHRAGQSAVFAEVIRQVPLIRRVLTKHGISAEHLDDLVQETLIYAWLSLRERPFRVPKRKTLTEAVRGWVTTLAKSRTPNFRRKMQLYNKRFVHDNAAIEQAVAVGSGPEEQIGSTEVLRALERLSPRLRRLLLMIGAGFTNEEIARELGGDPAAIDRRIQRARRAFREALIKP